MTDKPNCGIDLCPLKELPFDEDEFKGTCDLDGGDCIFPLNPTNWLDCTRLREYLMQDVIKELERLAYIAHCKSDYKTSQANYAAIILIKEGVKHE